VSGPDRKRAFFLIKKQRLVKLFVFTWRCTDLLMAKSELFGGSRGVNKFPGIFL
jgi:hypothetical protein